MKRSTTEADSNYAMTDAQIIENSGTSFVLSRQPSEAQEKEAFDGSQDIKIHFMVSWSTGSNGSP